MKLNNAKRRALRTAQAARNVAHGATRPTITGNAMVRATGCTLKGRTLETNGVADRKVHERLMVERLTFEHLARHGEVERLARSNARDKAAARRLVLLLRDNVAWC